MRLDHELLSSPEPHILKWLGIYPAFILYSLFFILYSLFFILYSLFFILLIP
ncbi:hypothetical protein [Pseudoalteromonas sp. NBT06-2]|uniref:hypothetical protein n=1 Tax=Pseudoalteromonas sp. NBT06-2 TaxID=2025950 RepID=UPI0014831962|nr:hypothetical protein [Pseudoalteromonas sp. NBT06-2]